MPVILVPVAGLLAGAVAGLTLVPVPSGWLLAGLVGWVMLAIHALQVRQSILLIASAWGAFAVGGAALSQDAWARAWRPPLRVVFESIAHAQKVEAIAEGLVVPEDGDAAVVLTGVLRADAAPSSSGAVSLSVDVEWLGSARHGSERFDAAANPVQGGVLLTVVGRLAPEQMPAWRAGRRIRTTATLRRPARYLDPGVPDQERALARRGVSLVGSVKSGALVSVESTGPLHAELAARIRGYARRAIAAGVGAWSVRASGIVSAIVIGDRTGLDVDVERRLQESGTYHVIAISGGNIALLAGLTLAAFRVAGLLGRSAMLSAALGLLAYGIVVGGGASVERAVFMACVYFVGRAWDLRGPPFQSLLLAAGALCLADPLSVADPASLLTFGATLAIVAVAPLMPDEGLPRLVRPVSSLFTASLAVEVVLLPVAASYFSRVTVAGLVLNFAAIPLMAVTQFTGMAIVPLHALSPAAARTIGWVAFAGAEGLVHTADLVALATWSTWRVPPPSAIAMVIYYAALLTASGVARQSVRLPALSAAPVFRLAIAAAAAAGIWIVAPPALRATHGDGRLHVTFIDVGQGDAALVRFPLGSSMLIDAGGLTGTATFDIGERVVMPVLWNAGVYRLEVLALSHGDADHIGGAPTLLHEFRPPDVWEGVPVPPHQALARLRGATQLQCTRWTTLQRGDRTSIDGVEVRVVHPPLPDWERQDVRNDDSTVLELRWKEVSVVFTGDIGRETEQAIAPLFEPAALRVLKVPHHGSSTSSSNAFVRALKPDVAVISVGRSNNFGHPAAAVLERYDAVGAQVFRTDRDGAVSLETNGSAISVSTTTGRAGTKTTASAR
ncbi:MAG: DNA internalization-related competence protein ComEC/Rec2 [Vicinamibacterales bacterium]